MERKSLAIIIVVVIVAAAGITIPLLIIFPPAPAAKDHLIFGVMYEMKDLDPHYSWDSASIDVLDQIVERLYAPDLSDPAMPIMPALATGDGEWSTNNLEWTIPLREGVTFHDGTPFNATAAKWNLDRVMYFTNWTGDLPAAVGKSAPSGLYAGKINKTEVIDEYTIKITLNDPCAFFQSLLSFCGAGMLSPTSTPEKTFIVTATGDCVGTGPFVYDSVEAGVEVLMHAYENYWDGASKIKKLTFTVITDANAKNAAMLSGDIDVIDDPLMALIEIYDMTTGINVSDPVGGVVTSYLGMNNLLINRDIREIISAALNYDYIIDELRDGRAIRLKSPIPIGIPFANDTFNVSVYDLTWARLLMKAEFPAETVGLNMSILETNTDWKDLAASTPILQYNYTYNIGNPTREAILPILQDNLGQIGIGISDAGVTWDAFLGRLYEEEGLTRNNLELYWLGWGPDYMDGENYINPLFTNVWPSSNGAQYNNPEVQLWMEEAALETDKAKRQVLYNKIQKQIVEIDKPWAFGYVPNIYRVHSEKLHGLLNNPADNWWFYPCYFEA